MTGCKSREPFALSSSGWNNRVLHPQPLRRTAGLLFNHRQRPIPVTDRSPICFVRQARSCGAMSAMAIGRRRFMNALAPSSTASSAIRSMAIRGWKPDRSIAFDAGIDQTLYRNRLRVSATYFYTELQQVIIFDFSGLIDPATDPFGRFGGYRQHEWRYRSRGGVEPDGHTDAHAESLQLPIRTRRRSNGRHKCRALVVPWSFPIISFRWLRPNDSVAGSWSILISPRRVTISRRSSTR